MTAKQTGNKQAHLQKAHGHPSMGQSEIYLSFLFVLFNGTCAFSVADLSSWQTAKPRKM
jgi:hypothetical protein